MRARVARERAHVFDLSAGPLFRASLLRLDAGDHVLLVGMHHIVGDAWSMGVFLRELSVLYDAYREGWDSPLTPLPVQYADYAAWQRSQPPAAEERHLAYWRRQLGGAPELLELPTDRPRPPVPSFRGAQVPVEAPLEVLDRLRALANAQGATLHMVLLGAFQVLLARYAGTLDVSVGIAVSGRSRREIEGLIGIFVNTLVLRTDLSGDPTFRAVVDRVRETALDAYQHQEVPFERVVAELRPQRSLSHSALFQVLFLLDELARPPPGARRPEPERAPAPRRARPGAPRAAAGVHAGRPHPRPPAPTRAACPARWSTPRTCSTRGPPGGWPATWSGCWSRSPPTRTCGSRSWSCSARRSARRCWRTWNRTGARVLRPDRCIHALFEAQAARTPDAVALVFDGEEALDLRRAGRARATGWRTHLRDLGVGPGDAGGAAAWSARRRCVVAVLGVLKAGGAYVPLDPAYPAERLAYHLPTRRVRCWSHGGRCAGRAAGSTALTVVRVDAACGRSAAEARARRRPRPTRAWRT